MRSKLTGTVLSCVLLILLSSACSEPPPPTSTPQPVSAPTSPASDTPQPVATAAQGEVDDLARVRAAGVLQVASSLDNPPFDMYNPQFKPDGFDIALMTELAKRLGVRADVQDYPFDGLLATLQTGQSDAVISAMAVTLDRQTKADFTRSYYRGEDAILAAPNSPISEVKTKADVAGRRVGVQRDSVYESFLLQNLVATGEMPKANLVSYGEPGNAVSDLQTGRVELVILDREPAATYVAGGQAKNVGKSMYVQDYAIAVRKGSTLAPELNAALAKVQADGTLSKLAEQYLQIPADQLVPLPTPAPTPVVPPTAAPTPTPAPVDGMKYIQDLSFDDHDGSQPPLVSPGQQLHKGWRIQNVGTTTWSPDYRLEYASGNTPISQMGGQPVRIDHAVTPGQTTDVYVDLIAPQTPGTYSAIWELKDASGTGFGRLSVMVFVPGPPTPPPPPTQPPAPGISFNVDRTQINAGECVNFSWSVTNVQAVYFCTGESCKGVAGQGGQKECPPSTTTYTLKVQRLDNSTDSRQYTINVAPAPNAPVIREFHADPSSIQQGQSVNLWWNVEGAACRIALVRGGKPLQDGAPSNGDYRDEPPGSGSVTYELQVWQQCDREPTTKRQQSVTIQGAPQPQTFTVYKEHCGSSYSMHPGDTLRVILEGAGGSGYEWEEQSGYNPSVLQPQGGVSKECGSGPGASCEYRWEYRAGGGKTNIKFIFHRPSEGDAPPAETCGVTATVQ